jgi:hypothetical protein
MSFFLMEYQFSASKGLKFLDFAKLSVKILLFFGSEEKQDN